MSLLANCTEAHRFIIKFLVDPKLNPCTLCRSVFVLVLACLPLVLASGALNIDTSALGESLGLFDYLITIHFTALLINSLHEQKDIDCPDSAGK